MSLNEQVHSDQGVDTQPAAPRDHIPDRRQNQEIAEAEEKQHHHSDGGQARDRGGKTDAAPRDTLARCQGWWQCGGCGGRSNALARVEGLLYGKGSHG